MDGTGAAFSISSFLTAALAVLGLAQALGGIGRQQPHRHLPAFPGPWNRWRARRRQRAFIRQLPDALQALASALRAGSNLARGLDAVARHQPAPVSDEFAQLIRRQRLGESVDRVFGELYARMPSEEVALLRSAIVVSQRVGGDLAGTLDSLAETLRERAAVEDRVQALTAMGRMQGRVMTLLPVAITAMLHLQQPDLMARLFTTPIGLGVLAVAVGMMALAAWSIHRIIQIDV